MSSIILAKKVGRSEVVGNVRQNSFTYEPDVPCGHAPSLYDLIILQQNLVFFDSDLPVDGTIISK
jgi:hypothetical protein